MSLAQRVRLVLLARMVLTDLPVRLALRDQPVLLVRLVLKVRLQRLPVPLVLLGRLALPVLLVQRRVTRLAWSCFWGACEDCGLHHCEGRGTVRPALGGVCP